MDIERIEKQRRWIGLGFLAAAAAGVCYLFSPGLPVLFAPRASEPVKTAGLALFERDWLADGPHPSAVTLGPVFNASSCVACHFQGGIGGAGPNTANVTAFTILPTPAAPTVREGVVHRFSSDPLAQETPDLVQRLFPVNKGAVRTFSGCQVVFADFNPVRFQSVSTPALFGSGWIDRIPAKAITHQSFKRGLAETAEELKGDFRARVPMGRYRILADGRVGKFGWKAQFATLEEFVGAACANELGLSNPVMDRVKPLAASAAAGGAKAPTTAPAPAPPGASHGTLSAREFGAMLAFVDTLPRPVEVLPDNPAERAMALRGRELFASVGCVECHTPDMAGVKGIYSDFLLHRIEERPADGGSSGGLGYAGGPPPQVPLPAEHPELDEWKTPPLWGAADSPPYFHDGSAPTLESAIERHRGDARVVSEAYRRLDPRDQRAVVAFLRTLKAPPDALPAPEAEQTEPLASSR